jgi:hypothetical protein
MFHSFSYVNSQNSRVSSATNPHESKDTPLHDQKVSVWCVISRNGKIGPIFFDDNINSRRYCEVIRYPFIGYLNKDEIARVCFQEEGATAHIPHVSMTLLRDVCVDRIISKHICPPQLSDLIPPDYYMWRKTNCAVYRDNPHTLLELKESIADFIWNIPPIELSRIFAKKIRRVDACLQVYSGHFQNLF